MSRQPSGAAKAALLLRLLPRAPREFADRVRALLEVRLERPFVGPDSEPARTFEEALPALGAALGHDLRVALAEPGLRRLEAELRVRAAGLRDGPFTSVHNPDVVLARLCYAVCRALAPRVVVETGVGYGVTTAFLLQALAANGAGELHSVDLPPLAPQADRHVGGLVPEALRARWQLHRGPSRRLLAPLLATLGPVGLFVHDSLHTFLGIRSELRAVAPRLAPHAAVIADDVDGNGAFQQWARARRPAFWAVVRDAEKPGCCGVAAFRPPAA